MSLDEDKLNAGQIVVKAGMSDRPGFYSGRGATTTDLNDMILEKIYQEIKKEHGEDSAKQFTQMVADIPKLSATDFLLSLYRLEMNDWNWSKELLGEEKGIYPEDEGSALGTIFSALSGSGNVDETDYIRTAFLERHEYNK